MLNQYNSVVRCFIHKMKIRNTLVIGAYCLLLILITVAPSIESKRLIFRRDPNITKLPHHEIHTTNIADAPIIHCRSGYRLDVRNKCRKVIGF